MSKRKDDHMSPQTREHRLNKAFVALADTLVDDFDVVDLLHTLVTECAGILDTSAGGIMLVDAKGQLHLVASTNEQSTLVEIMQLNAGAGPCVDCFTSGAPVTVGDIDVDGAKWPDFRAEALKLGFRSVHATPMRLRGEILGAMNLFSTKLGELNPEDIAVAKALTDVATIGLLQARGVKESRAIAGQLQHALDSRIIIEQAKGVVSEQFGLSMSDSFAALRQSARSNNRTLTDVARNVVDRKITVGAPTSMAPRP